MLLALLISCPLSDAYVRGNDCGHTLTHTSRYSDPKSLEFGLGNRVHFLFARQQHMLYIYAVRFVY